MSYRKYFLGTKKRVRIIQGKPAVGVGDIEVLLYLVNQWLDFYQIFLDMQLGHNKETLDFGDIDLIYKVTAVEETENSMGNNCFITKTCLYNVYPLKPHFYIVKLGFTGVYIIVLISALKHRLWVLVRTAS